MGAGGGLGNGDAAVDLQRGVVVDRGPRIVGRAVEDAAVAVVGVLVDAQIGHQHHSIADVGGKIGEAQLHNSLRVEGFRADGILGGRHPEQDHGADAEVGQLVDLGAQALARVLHHPGQRHDRLRSSMPSRTNSGATRLATSRRVSATRCRSAADVRNRRGRETGKLPATNGHRRPYREGFIR